MDELVRWLGEQLDKDAAIARELAGRGGDDLPAGLRSAGGQVRDAYGDPEPPEDGVGPADRLWWLARDAADWIEAWSPARVLREIDVDRELLAEYERLLSAYAAHRQEVDRLAESGDDDPIRRSALRREADYLPAMLHVMERWTKRKAVVFADRPGYRAEWRP